MSRPCPGEKQIILIYIIAIAAASICNCCIFLLSVSHSIVFVSVGENDIFPEEFSKFLIGRSDVRKMFLEKIKFSFAPDSRPVFPVTTFASVYEKCARAASLMPLTQHRKPVG